MVRSLREYIKKTKFGTIIAPVILLIVLLYFYVNGSLFFGALWVGFQPIILLYVILLLAAFVLAPKLLTVDPKAPIWMEAVAYIVPALILNAVLYFAGIRGGLGPTSSNPYPVILLQVAVTGTEEVFFRGALYERTSGQGAPLWFAASFSAAVFGAFHAYAYGINIISIILAVAAGFMFYIIYDSTKDQYGLAVNTGLHLGYNVALLGILLIAPFGF